MEFVIFEAFFHVSDIYELVQAVIFLTNEPATANPGKAFDYRLSFPLIQASKLSTITENASTTSHEGCPKGPNYP